MPHQHCLVHGRVSCPVCQITAGPAGKQQLGDFQMTLCSPHHQRSISMDRHLVDTMAPALSNSSNPRHLQKLFNNLPLLQCPLLNANKTLLAQLPGTQFTHSKAPNPHARNTSTQIFASPDSTATPNEIYTKQRAKPTCQEDINTQFSHLLLTQLPRTQFTHSNAPNPHASKTSTEKFSRLLLAQLPRTQFTHSNAPNPNARKTSTRNFRISYWHSGPEHNLHTATRQTRTPGRHQTQNFRISDWHSSPEGNLHTATRQSQFSLSF